MTKLPLQFYMNGPTIMIGQLGLIQLTNWKIGSKNVHKQINRQFINKISINV